MRSALSWKRWTAICAVAGAALVGASTPASADTSITFRPVAVTDVPPAPDEDDPNPIQKVQALGHISAPVTAGQTAYVYSTLHAYNSAHVNLVDSEVRCSGAGVSNVVLGENIDPAGSAQPGRDDITIVNRFLVSATSTGTLTCTIYVRTVSLSKNTSSFTVDGTLRFAAQQVAEDADGLAMQTSLPNGNTEVGSSKVYKPILDRTIGPGHSQVAVIADVEYMSCFLKGSCPTSSTASGARFTLYAKQMNGDATCAEAEAAQTSVTVSRQTHHKVVPLYTILTLAPGCDRIYAYVRAEYTSGPTGAIQGLAPNLSDETGGPLSPGPHHDSAMTHMFAVPS
jgi:hypothetical protein